MTWVGWMRQRAALQVPLGRWRAAGTLDGTMALKEGGYRPRKALSGQWPSEVVLSWRHSALRGRGTGKIPCGYTSPAHLELFYSAPGTSEQRHSLQYGNRQFAQHPQCRPFPLGAAVDRLRQLLFYFFQPFPKTTKIHDSNLLRRLHRQSSNFEPQRHAVLKKTSQSDSDIEAANAVHRVARGLSSRPLHRLSRGAWRFSEWHWVAVQGRRHPTCL